MSGARPRPWPRDPRPRLPTTGAIGWGSWPLTIRAPHRWGQGLTWLRVFVNVVSLGVNRLMGWMLVWDLTFNSKKRTACSQSDSVAFFI